MSKKSRYKLNPMLYLLPGEGITHKIIDQVTPKRVVFYSSVLALASAALAFLGQISMNDEVKPGPLMISSIICFGLSILVLLLIYFLQIVHTTYWSKIEHYYTQAFEVEAFDNPSEIIKHKYFKEKPEDLKRLQDALFISSRLMNFEVVLDMSLLLLTFLGVITYCTHLITY